MSLVILLNGSSIIRSGNGARFLDSLSKISSTAHMSNSSLSYHGIPLANKTDSEFDQLSSYGQGVWTMVYRGLV